jgi:hypothetical protein
MLICGTWLTSLSGEVMSAFERLAEMGEPPGNARNNNELEAVCWTFKDCIGLPIAAALR